MSVRSLVKVDAARLALRDRILAVATDLFIRHGYKTVSFLVIARALGVTHSNVHYYFKTKADLAEAVLEAYAADTVADFRAIWTAETSDLLSMFVQSRDWIWRQYIKFNPDGVGGHNWGLLARFAGEADLLTPAMRQCLARTLTTMDALIETGIDLAVRHGELSPQVPKHALVLQISSLIHTSRHLTRIEGNFERLDELLRWTLDVIRRAYGSQKPARAWPPVMQPREPRKVSHVRN
jgi:TetR/AcrR family transcriptional repressor of nem operon